MTTARRWGAQERVDDEDAARERLLAAAEVCFERHGLRETTIDDVAREAKVSRSTVYRYFDGRGDLIVAAYLRENDAVSAKVEALMHKPGPFADRVVKGAVRSIEAVRRGKYLSLMLSPEGSFVASKAVTASEAFYASCMETMRPFFEQAQADGEVRADIRLDDFIEWMVRVILSFALFDSPAPRAKTSVERLLTTFLGPSLTP